MLGGLFLAAGLALAPTGAMSRLQLDADGGPGYTQLAPATVPVSAAYQLQGGAGASLSLFTSGPILDDDAPLGLQPFLQRAGRLRIGGGGSGFRTAYVLADGSGTVARAGSFGHADLSFETYLLRVVYLSASLSVQPTHYQDSNAFGEAPPVDVIDLPLAIAVGGRFRDLLLTASWGIRPGSTGGDTFNVPFWGGAGLSAQWVIARRWSLSGGVVGLDSGARGTLGAELFCGRRLGVFASLTGGQGRYSSSRELFQFVGGRAGAFVWASRFFGVGLSYSATYTDVPSGAGARAELAHLFDVSFSSRPR